MACTELMWRVIPREPRLGVRRAAVTPLSSHVVVRSILSSLSLGFPISEAPAPAWTISGCSCEGGEYSDGYEVVL